MRDPVARRGEQWLAVAVFLALAGMLAMACGRSDPPRLEANPLPVSSEATSGDRRFQLRNVGGRPLEFDGVAPACDCAVTSRLPATLASDASTMLDLRCRLPRTVGDVVREIRLDSSDPSNPETTLRVTLSGQAVGPDPAGLYFGYVAVGQSAVRDVVLPGAVSAESVRLSASSGLGVEPMPARADGAHRLRVRFTPRLAGVVRATIDLGSAGGALPVIAVGYEGVLAFPAEVRIADVAGNASLPAITLIGVGDEPLAIGHVDYPVGITGELRSVVAGRQFRLVLRSRGSAATPGSAIRLHRENGGAPILTIPIVGAGTGAVVVPTT